MNTKHLLTIPQAAALMDSPVSTTRARVKSGALPHVEVDGRKRIDPAAIEKFKPRPQGKPRKLPPIAEILAELEGMTELNKVAVWSKAHKFKASTVHEALSTHKAKSDDG